MFVLSPPVPRSVSPRPTLTGAFPRYVKTDAQFQRPGQPSRLLADPTKAREKLGWTAKTSFEELIRMMIREMSKEGKRKP